MHAKKLNLPKVLMPQADLDYVDTELLVYSSKIIGPASFEVELNLSAQLCSNVLELLTH